MRILNKMAHSLIQHMCVNLRRRNVSMTQHLLERSQIGAVSQQMASKRVPNYVRADATWVNIAVVRMGLKHLAESLTG